MKKIRHGVFETNSSSTHSVTFQSRQSNLEKSTLEIQDDGYIHTQFGEFGWEIESYRSQEDKLSYLITMLCETNGISTNWWGNNEIEQIRSALDNNSDFERLNNEIISYTGCPNGIYLDDSQGYIDHQSCEYRNVSDFLTDWGINDAIEFIFDSSIIVNTDNDNH